MTTRQVYYLPDLMRVLARSRSWVLEKVKIGMIPKPFKIGCRDAWRKPEIDRLFGLEPEPATKPATVPAPHLATAGVA